jgi:hypothetical protein
MIDGHAETRALRAVRARQGETRLLVRDERLDLGRPCEGDIQDDTEGGSAVRVDGAS